MFEEIVGAQKLPTGEVKTNKKIKKILLWETVLK